MSPRGFALDLLLLLMLDEERGAFRGGARLAYGLSAALLADLALLGRVVVRPEAVIAREATRTGHAVLDEHFAQVRASAPRAAEEWIAAWARPSLIERVTERLVVAGTLDTRVDRTLGMFAVRRLRIVPPRLQITVTALIRGVVLGEAQAVPGELAAVAAILTILGEHRLLRVNGSTAARASSLARADATAAALDRALGRRSVTGPAPVSAIF